MANKKKNDSEVLELEAIEEVPLEKIIDNTLVKHNVTNAVINGLKEKYGELRLRSIDDKESYLEICDARKDVRKYGILAEKICKAGREDAIKIQKLWLSKQSEVLGKIAEVQDPLDSEIDKYEQEVKRKETELANRREEAYMKRQQQLLRMGATYQDGSFVLNHISYEATLVKESDDDIWAETILPKYQKEYEKNEAERVAIEKMREEDAAKMKVEREAFEEQQRVFREQQLAFEKQQQEATKIIQEQKRQKLIARGNQLAALGMTFNFQKDAYVYEDISVDNKTEVGLWSDSDWDELLNKIAPIIEDKKADLEVKRLEKIEAEKKLAEEIAVKKEREKIELERIQKEETLNQASDKVKYEDVLSQIRGIKLHEMKTSVYKKKMVIISDTIKNIL